METTFLCEYLINVIKHYMIKHYMIKQTTFFTYE